MRNNSLLRSTLLFAAIAIAAPVFAKPVTKSLPITHPVRVGQVNVNTGEYRVIIDGNHLSLTRGKQTVAESEGRWEDRNAKSPYTEIVSNAEGKVTELRFEGQKSVFVLAQ